MKGNVKIQVTNGSRALTDEEVEAVKKQNGGRELIQLNLIGLGFIYIKKLSVLDVLELHELKLVDKVKALFDRHALKFYSINFSQLEANESAMLAFIQATGEICKLPEAMESTIKKK